VHYTEFRDSIATALRTNRTGLTWPQLQSKLKLPYDRPCPAWTAQLEKEIGLSRVKGAGRALVWMIGSQMA
jgi:hypothetical protein